MSVQEKAPIATLADLAGKKIGIQTGGNETIFDGFCKANGIDKSIVHDRARAVRPLGRGDR